MFIPPAGSNWEPAGDFSFLLTIVKHTELINIPGLTQGRGVGVNVLHLSREPEHSGTWRQVMEVALAVL